MIGKLFVVESGVDASGKATQSQKLYERLIEEGKKVKKITFPNYQSPSSALVKMYLNGDFGEHADDVNPYTASTFYAVDRFASYATEWKSFYDEGGIIIADRYTTSNMVHQACKFDDVDEKQEFLDWLWDLEFKKMKLPIPDAVIFLNMDLNVSFELMSNRPNKINGEDTKDIHEKDREYLSKSYENSLWICEKYHWKPITCTTHEGIKSIEDIHQEVYSIIKNLI